MDLDMIYIPCEPSVLNATALCLHEHKECTLEKVAVQTVESGDIIAISRLCEQPYYPPI